MAKIEEFYKDHAVKITSNGISGSGCIYQPSSNECSYILTAKHCITENDKYDIEKIEIKRHLANAEIQKLHLKQIIFHKDFDLAILVVGKILGLNTISIHKPTKDENVFIYGYPNLLKHKEEPRQIIDCKVSFSNENHNELTSTHQQFTFEKGIPETITGLSGSGVFSENSGVLSLTGIFTRLKAPDGAYNSLCAFNLNVFEDVLISNNLPSLFADNISNIKKDYELTNNVFSLTYNSKSEPYYLTRTIDQVFENYLNTSKDVWISGLSGVGKTFMILRNIKNNTNQSIHIDLTCSFSENINDYFEYINNELISQTNLENVSTRTNIYDKISDNLCEINLQSNQILIFVDEVPISKKEKFYDFLSGFIMISERYTNLVSGVKNIKWIISTRINPINHLNNSEDCLTNKNKAQKNFVFKDLSKWEHPELLNLLKLLQESLNFMLSDKTEKTILNASKGLPGVLKNVIERIIIDNCSIEEAVQIIKSENI